MSATFGRLIAYEKAGEWKHLTPAQSVSQHAALIADGWAHRATVMQVELHRDTGSIIWGADVIAAGTPRTEAQVLSRGAHSASLGVFYVPVDFAQQLERELTAAWSEHQCTLEQLRAARDELDRIHALFHGVLGAGDAGGTAAVENN